MTDTHFIDPSQFLADQLAEASPDALITSRCAGTGRAARFDPSQR